MHSAAMPMRGVDGLADAPAQPRHDRHVDEHDRDQHALQVRHRRGVVEAVGVGQRVAGDAGAARERVAAVARVRAAVEPAREQDARRDHADPDGLAALTCVPSATTPTSSTSTGATPRDSG